MNCVLPFVWQEAFQEANLDDDESDESDDQRGSFDICTAGHYSPLRITGLIRPDYSIAFVILAAYCLINAVHSTGRCNTI